MLSRSNLLKLLSAFFVFGAWEVAGRIPVSFAFKTFLESITALAILIWDGTLFTAYGETLRPLVVGILISGFFGIGIGLFIGLNRKLDWLVSPIFSAMQTPPCCANPVIGNGLRDWADFKGICCKHHGNARHRPK